MTNEIRDQYDEEYPGFKDAWFNSKDEDAENEDED